MGAGRTQNPAGLPLVGPVPRMPPDEKRGRESLDSSLRVNFPPDPNPKKPRLAVPKGAVDTHFHVYGPPNIFPFVDKRRYTPPAAPVEHYLQVAAVLGLERGIMVQPNV